MPRPLGTLRSYLAALNLAVFGVILSAVCILVLTVGENYLRQEFDDWLTGLAGSIAGNIVVPEPLVARDPLQGNQGQLWIPFDLPGLYIQIRSTYGSVLEKSRSLKDAALPFNEPEARTHDTETAVLETVSGGALDALVGPGIPLRMLTLYRDEPNGAPYYLQVAVSAARLNNALGRLHKLIVILMAIGMAAVGLASWLMAKRALAPIGRIARDLQRLTAARLDQRIAVPTEGDELAEMVVTANRMLDRLQTAFDAQQRFLANAAHELKTPVTVLLGEAQVLRRHPRKLEEYERFMSSVQDEMRRFAQMIDGLLILARSHAGFPIPLAELVSLNEVVTNAVQSCQPLAQQHEVRLVLTLATPKSDASEALVLGDGELLSVMVANLIRNAIGYASEGKVVEIVVATENIEASVTVRDHGPGIPDDLLARIFDPFFRIPRGTNAGEGAGLGLSIAKGVAELHRGTIHASNHAGGGCEFKAQLPLVLSSSTPTPASTD